MSWRLDSDGGHIDRALVPIDVRDIFSRRLGTSSRTRLTRASKKQAEVTRSRGIIGGVRICKLTVSVMKPSPI